MWAQHHSKVGIPTTKAVDIEESGAVVRVATGSMLKNCRHLIPEDGYFQGRDAWARASRPRRALREPSATSSRTKHVAIITDQRHVLLAFRCPVPLSIRTQPRQSSTTKMWAGRWWMSSTLSHQSCHATLLGFTKFNMDVIDRRALDLCETPECELRKGSHVTRPRPRKTHPFDQAG
ncbi:hypothetical protein BC830DRAFT_913350 [Chytriomyces sp. MP71]|nr:hypothetical protein BC830DRAFT_913350 [Chytriomyces sp. MP71]